MWDEPYHSLDFNFGCHGYGEPEETEGHAGRCSYGNDSTVMVTMLFRVTLLLIVTLCMGKKWLDH